MPTIAKQCSVFNGFNFKRDVQESVGHITQLKIGDKDLTADLELVKPTDEAKEKVVGVISSFMWEGGYAQPLSFTFQVSITNKNEIATLLHSTMKSIAITITFNIYEYDPEKKAFFLAVHSNSASLTSVLQVQGSERVLYLEDQAGMEVEQPLNYGVTLGIVPEDKQQEIHVAVSTDKKMVKPWGVTRG